MPNKAWKAFHRSYGKGNFQKHYQHLNCNCDLRANSPGWTYELICNRRNKSEMYIQCREGEFRRYLKNAVREFETDIEVDKVEECITENLQIKTNRSSISIHHKYAQKKKWKKIMHKALHQFAHHPTNRKNWYWKKRRCWQPEQTGNVLDVPTLPDADEKEHQCDKCHEPQPHEKNAELKVRDEPDNSPTIDQLNWANIKTIYTSAKDNQVYTIKLLKLGTDTWNDYLQQIVNSNRRYLKLKQAMLILPNYNNHHDQCFAVIKGKSRTKLAKVLKPLHERHVLKPNNEVISASDMEILRYNKVNKKRNKAVITGCNTLEQCQQYETYINAIKPKEGFFNWYKHRTNREWIFEITPQHKSAKDTFIHEWMQGKKQNHEYNHLNV